MHRMHASARAVLVALVCVLAVGMPTVMGAPKGLLLHLSFDAKLTADFAGGNPLGSQRNPGHSVQYIEGVRGKAVLLDNGSIFYETKGNLCIPQGTVMLWIKPIGWNPARPSKKWIGFFDAHQRVGRGGEDKLSFWRYPETMSAGHYNYHSAQGNNLDSLFVREVAGWEKGQWKFFAFTWDEKGMARVFVDGKLSFHRQRKRDALPVTLNELSIAASGTAYDEFRVFDRPLREDEIRQYFGEADAAVLKARTGPGSPVYSAGGRIAFPAGPATTCANPIMGPITIDGILDETAWATCVEFQDMSLSTGSESPVNRTSFRVGYTSETLYVAAMCSDRGGKPKVTVRKHGGPVYTDDSVELFLAPKAGGKEYYQFVANAVAARYEGRAMDGSWAGRWEVAGTQGKGKWCLEIAIPFATIGVTATPGEVLGFNVCRNDKSANQSQTWADLGGFAFHAPSRFGRLILGKTRVGASATSMVFRKDGHVTIRGRLRNAGRTPTAVKWLTAGNAGGSALRFEEDVKIDPGKNKVIEKTGPGCGPRGRVGWRSALWADGQLLYLSPGRTASFLALAPLVEASEPLTLENGKVRLRFDSYNGALVSLKNLQTGLELMPRGPAQPLFSLDVVSFQKHPYFFAEDNVIALEASNDTARACTVKKRKDGTQVLTATHAFKEGVKVIATVAVPVDSAISKWTIRVENRLPIRPREAVIVHRVAFPQLGGLRAAKDDKAQALAWPKEAGFLFTEPARKTAKKTKKVESPGGASMSWVDLSGPEGGLYLAGHDVEPVVPTTFEATGDGKNAEVSLTVRRWSLLWPQRDWQPQPCSVGIHPGDWHWSADQYREWFYANCPVRPTPQWVRDEDAWLMDGGGPNRATVADIATHLTVAQNMGVNYIQSWQHWMATDTDHILGAQMPNVYGGTEEEFKKALADLHARGGRIGFYFDGHDMETRLGGILRQPKYFQKLPKDIVKTMPAADPLADGWLQAAVLSPDGSYRMGWPSGIDTWAACNGSKAWSDWVYYWVVTKYHKQYKSDTWYQDCSPWIGQGVCFHPDHGHAKPLPRAQALVDLGNRILKDVSSDFGILGESMCDRLWNYQTHSLWLAGVGLKDSEPALFIYTHPRFPLFCGCCCFFAPGGKQLSKNFYRGEIEKLSAADMLRYVLLHGQRFDYCFGGPRRSGEEYLSTGMKELRDIIRLRRAVHKDLEASRFKDRIGLSGMPDNVEARLFVSDDKRRALIGILDFRKKQKAFAISLDTAAHGLKTLVAAELVLPGGRLVALPKPTRQTRVVRVSLPAGGKEMYFVRLAAQQ